MSQGPRRPLTRLCLLSLALIALLGCASAPPPAPRRFELDVAPAFSGVSAELSQVTSAARPSLVRIQVENRVFKPLGDYLLGIGESLFGVLNPHPYWEWPYRVVRLPLFILFGHLDLGSSRGSGFFVSDELVLSCAHVVDNAAEITLQLDDGRLARAELVAVDEVRDLVLLRAKGLSGPPPPPLQLRQAQGAPGEVVLALGYPSRDPVRDPRVPRGAFDEDLGRPNPRVTVGIVSAVDVELGNALTPYLELDAALNPGNSGGPILGLDGRVLGVATMVSVGKENEGYAVPVGAIYSAFAEHLSPEHGQSPLAPRSPETPGGD